MAYGSNIFTNPATNQPYTNLLNTPRQVVYPSTPYKRPVNSTPFDPSILKKNTTQVKKDTPVYNTSTGSGATRAAAIAAPVVQNPWYYSGDDIAKKFGIQNNYDTILNELLGVANKKFEMAETQAKRAGDSGIRAARMGYDEYINRLQQTKTNAAQTGMRKGLSAAEAVTQMLMGSQALSESQQATRDQLYDLGEAQGLAQAEATTMARTQHNQIGQYLGTLGAQYEGNDVNRLAAQLAADAQVKAASIGANATVSAANSADRFLYEIMQKVYPTDYNERFITKKDQATGIPEMLARIKAMEKGN